jgi:hypothetical protein
MEQWKEIAGYEGIYEVSDAGNVRSIIARKNSYFGKIMAARLRPNGYRQFTLTRDGVVRYFKASRLVATAFIPNPENKPTVNHKNGIKHDDCLSNLEWATFQENSQHAYDTGLAKPRLGELQRSARLKEKQIPVIRELLRSGKHYSEVGIMFGVNKTTIADIQQGRTWAWLQ